MSCMHTFPKGCACAWSFTTLTLYYDATSITLRGHYLAFCSAGK
jgi:hypothetical protein